MRIDNDLFPFRFLFSRDLVVTEMGSALQKIAGSCKVGCDLRQLATPSDGRWEPTFDLIRDSRQNSFDISLIESGVTLRCQLTEAGNQLAVLGSPRFNSLAELAAAGLTTDDFAPHDAAVELLQLQDAQQPPAHESKTVQFPRIADLENSKPKPDDAISHVLQAAGDVYLRMQPDGTVLDATVSRPDLLQTNTEELVGNSIYEACPQFSVAMRAGIEELENDGGRVSFPLELSTHGVRTCLDASITKTAFGEIVMLARDVTEQRELRAELIHRASHDALTNLPNRTCFMELVGSALESNELIAVFFVDLDGFKLVNDRHGHQLGDELLTHVARTIQKCLKPGDHAARLGGDEFAILLRNLDSKQAAEGVAARILEELQQPTRIGHRKMAASASIGIATSYDSRDITTLFQFADVAMYEAKDRHKCCYVVFEPAMYEELIRRDTLHQQLVAAGQQGQFINHYQPIVHIESGRSHGFEALARWEHPIRGLLMPSDFLRTAEETEAIIRLGEHTVSNVCQDFVTWKTEGLFAPNQQPRIHVNVSPLQFIKGCLPTMLSKTCDEYDVAHQHLTIEVKEQTLQEHFETASTEIAKLHELGFKIAIDDFGAGNSSLAFIDRLPLDGIKLARSFVGYLGKKQRNRLVQAVVELALEFDLEVVAVGIETPQQCDLLMSYGCHLGQGEYFSEPISSRDRKQIGASLHIPTRRAKSPSELIA